jgi:signal transduction histidine kinase
MPRRDPPASDAIDPALVAPTLIHELKQPLMGADACARLLERARGDALAADETWRTLRTQVDRLVEIVRGYEALLRAGDAQRAAYGVGAAVRRAVALLAHRVQRLEQRFALEGDDWDRPGFGVPGALVHAATNVLANALDAVEGLPGAPRVRVRLLGGAGGVEVRVSDEGVGIPETHRRRLFEPRFTTKAPGCGSGLGLHLARRLMVRDGGTVFLVADDDPARLPWAVTEFCIAVPAPPEGGSP